MPIHEYVRNVREAFHREPHSGSSTSAGRASQLPNDKSATAGTRWAFRGDLPSDKICIPDACAATLTSTVFRPQDKLNGVVTGLHGALGSLSGYSAVQVGLYAVVRLVQTSEEGTSCTPIPSGEGMVSLVPHRYDIDTFQQRLIKVAGHTLYKYSDDGKKEGKEINLPFQLRIPSEVEGLQLAPSLTEYIRYYISIGALEYTTGKWRELCLDGIKIKPRDDALQSIDSLSICDPFLMIGNYQELDLAKQPRWILAKEHVQQISCPSAPKFVKKAQVEEAQGTVVVRLYTPPHDMFVQRPFPLVVKLSVIAPSSYGPKDADWKAFWLEIPAGDAGRHKVYTMIKMQVSPARGGDGDSYERVALTTGVHWDAVQPSTKEGKRASEGAGEGAWELKSGLDWSEPQLEHSASRFAGRWASHAIVKGVVNLPPITPPTFFSRLGDLQIYHSIDLMFWHQGRYMTTSVMQVTRDLSHPLQEDAEVSDGDQPPPYAT